MRSELSHKRCPLVDEDAYLATSIESLLVSLGYDYAHQVAQAFTQKVTHTYGQRHSRSYYTCRISHALSLYGDHYLFTESPAPIRLHHRRRFAAHDDYLSRRYAFLQMRAFALINVMRSPS